MWKSLFKRLGIKKNYTKSQIPAKESSGNADIYDLIFQSQKWLRAYNQSKTEKRAGAIWSRERIIEHLDKSLQVFGEDKLYTNGEKTDRHGKAIDPSDKHLLHICYKIMRDLLINSKLYEQKNAFDEGMKNELSLLLKARGNRYRSLMIDMYGFFNNMCSLGPIKMKGNLESFINKVETYLHVGWGDKYNPEKIALLMVLDYWRYELKIVKYSDITINNKTTLLPFNTREDMSIYIELTKKDLSILNLKVIMEHVQNHKNMATIVDGVYDIKEWIAESHIIQFKIYTTENAEKDDHLYFSVALYDVDEVKINSSTILISNSIKSSMATTWYDAEITESDDPLGTWYIKKLRNMVDIYPGRIHIINILQCASIGDILVGSTTNLDEDAQSTMKIQEDNIFNAIKNLQPNSKRFSNDIGFENQIYSRQIRSQINRSSVKNNSIAVIFERYSNSVEAIKRKNTIDQLALKSNLQHKIQAYVFDISSFLMDTFPGVVFDNYAVENLRSYLSEIRSREVLNTLCEGLLSELEVSGARYVSVHTIQKVWEEKSNRVILILKRPENDKLINLMKNIQDILGTAYDESKTVTLSVIAEKCSNLSSEELIESMYNLKEWFIEDDGIRFRFRSRVHWEKVNSFKISASTEG